MEEKVININEVVSANETEENTVNAVEEDDKNGEESKTVEIDPKDYEPVVELDGKNDDEIIELALKRLNEQADTGDNGVPAIAIYLWMIEKIKSDVEFAKRTLLKSKVLAKSFQYLVDIAYQRAQAVAKASSQKSVGIGMSDAEIYSYIEEYYMLNDYEIDKRKAEEKAKAEEKRKQAEAERKAKAASSGKKSEKKKSSAKKPSAKKAEPKKEEPEEEPDLFSLLGGC